MNDLGVDVAVNRIFDAREVADTDRDGPKFFMLAASASKKIVTRDGEVWSAEYTVAGQKRRTGEPSTSLQLRKWFRIVHIRAGPQRSLSTADGGPFRRSG